jgi:hypothetical protein
MIGIILSCWLFLLQLAIRVAPKHCHGWSCPVHAPVQLLISVTDLT